MRAATTCAAEYYASLAAGVHGRLLTWPLGRLTTYVPLFMSPPISRWATTSSDERLLKERLTLARVPLALIRIVAIPEPVEPVVFDVGRICDMKRVGAMAWIVTVAALAEPTV